MRRLVSRSKARLNAPNAPSEDVKQPATEAGPSASESQLISTFAEPPIVGRPGELTRLIEKVCQENVPDYLAVVREIFQRTVANDTQAREASVALFNQLGRVPVRLCLRAIRLWALMLRYCPSEKFLHKTTRKDWLSAVKVICLSMDKDQAAHNRALEVVAGARHAFPTNGTRHESPANAAFRRLWFRVKREGDPAEGIPFTNPLFSLPSTNSKFDFDMAADPEGHAAVMQRLVVSCELARDRARRLNELLDIGALDETAEVIIDVHDKCIASRDFIRSQLPWATVNADRSVERSAADHTGPDQSKGNGSGGGREQTFEEQLLGMLLEANEELNDVIWRHEAETAIPEAAAASPPPSPDNRPSGSGLSRLSSNSQASGSRLSTSSLPPEPLRPLSASALLRPLPRPPSSARAASQLVPPPPYAPPEPAPVPASANTTGGADVDIGSALPPSVLAYLEERHLPREVLYDVELALDGDNTRAWLSALADIPQLTGTDCKAIALLNRRAMAGETES